MDRRHRIRFNTFLAMMRKGKNVTLEQLAWGLCSVSMLKRIEEGERLPDKMLRDRLLDRLGLVNDGFEDFMWPKEYILWKERQELLRTIEDNDVEKAEQIIYRYEQENTDKNKIESQFYLAMKSQVMQYQDAGQEELRAVFRRALDCTLPGSGIDQWKESLLAVQEWNLLLEYIRWGGDVGQIPTGSKDTYQAAAYEAVMSAIQGSVMDSYCCVKIYPKAAYYLCLEWMKKPVAERPYDRMLQVCDSAVEMLRSTKRMFYLYELLEIMERALEGFDSLQPELLTQVREWRGILAELYQKYGIPERMGNCVYLYWQTKNYNIGELVRMRREMLGMSTGELCGGICHEKTLRRLENGEVRTQREIVEEMLERLGLSPEYQRQRIVTDNYEVLVLYDAVCKALNNRDMEMMDRTLSQMKKMLSMDLVINRQEIECFESLYLWHSGKITQQECVCRLRRILEYTVPLKRIKQSQERYLSYGEMVYLYNVADKIDGEEKDSLIGMMQDICEKLVSENGVRAHISIYELIMQSVASHLGNKEEYDRSDEITDRIMREGLMARRMTMLDVCVYNNLWNRLERLKESDSAEPKNYVDTELQKCVQLARLCKKVLFEDFYTKKHGKLRRE